MIDLTGIKKFSASEGYLYDADPLEVSLVKRPANKREYLLTKTRKTRDMDELLKAIKSVEADNEAELEKALEGLSDDAVAAAKAIARIQHAYSEEVDSEVLAKALGIELEKATEVEPSADDKDVLSKSELEAMDPALRSKVESVLEKSQKLEERVDGVTETLAKAAEERKTAEIRKQVDGFTHLGAEIDDITSIVKSVSDHAGDEAAEKVVEMLKSANEVASKGADDLYTTKGSGGHGGGSASSAVEAYDEIEKRAREAVRKSDGDLTLSQAMRQVMDEDADLARAYRNN